MLLGVNDEAAARAMHLDANDYSGSGRSAGRRGQLRFVSWIRDQISTGAKVSPGVYIKGADDGEYDPIVPDLYCVHRGVNAGRNGWSKARLRFDDNVSQQVSGTFDRLLRDARRANQRL